jgi:hypothetical protein
MKKLIIFFVPAFFLFFLPAIIDSKNNSFARSGCCMERKSESSEKWYKNGLGYSKCRELNQEKDGDDLYIKSGYIYWNENC